MVQLSSKVMFACIPADASWMRSRHVLHVFWMHSACFLDTSRVLQKGHGGYVKSYCSFIMRFYACMDASHARSGHVSNAFWTHLTRILDISCTRSRRMRMLPWS